MAEPMDETDDEFLGAQTAENVDTIPLSSDASTPRSDQMEVNAVVGNEVEGPAAVLPIPKAVPKLMTPVGCLNEICVVRKLSIPHYESRDEVGVAHMKIFTMGVWVRDMDLRETGHGRTKMEAKHEAATRVLDKLRRAGERNESLHRVTPEVVRKCYEMLKKCVIAEPPTAESESEKTRFSAGSLKAFEMAQGMTPSVYDCANVSGPPHNRTFTMTCKQGDYITRGTGKSKQIGKHIAASHMLKILSESPNEANAQQQQQDSIEEEADQVRLPDLVYSLLIDKHLDESSSTALAISEFFYGFSPLYTTSRKTKGLVVDHKSSYFTPQLWSSFIERYISLDSIKVLNLNNVYWLPGDLLVSTILEMPNLHDLSIRGTQVCTICQVAKLLKANPKILKLDFTYTEKTVKDVWEGLKKEIDTTTCSSSFGAYLDSCFQKLTSLKMATTVHDAKDCLLEDPWRLVIYILTCCRDCKDLSIEITYTGVYGGDNLEWEEFENALIFIEDQCFPKLTWMKTLNHLAFIKLGPSSTYGTLAGRICSLVLSKLFGWLFPATTGNVKPIADRPHRSIWIQGFEVSSDVVLDYADRKCLESMMVDGYDWYDDDEDDDDDDDDGAYEDDPDEIFEEFRNLVQLGGIYRRAPSNSKSWMYSKKLIYLSIVISSDEKEIYKFCKLYPNLERLCVMDCPSIDIPSSDAVFKLPKLQSFSFKCYDISQAFLEAISNAYPNLENLELINKTCRYSTSPPDELALSAISFSRLTSLSLRGFQLRDGAVLLQIIDKCPKLEILHLETDSLEATSFLSIFKRFLCKAINLREFRLKWKHGGDDYTATVLSILEFLLENKKSLLLERLVLIEDGGSQNKRKRRRWTASPPPPGFSDRLLEFTSKMTHMTCCCLTFNQLDPKLMKEIKERVELEVVKERPSLWFHLGHVIPQACDAGVPLIHYHQIVEPVSFVVPLL